MLKWPSVNPLVAIGAGVAAFLIGGAYWALVSRFIPAMGALPVFGLAVGLVTRMLIAYGIAVILAMAATRGPRAGALVGALAWLAFVFTMLLAEGMFGQLTWTQVLAGAPESLIGYSIMGAIVGKWAVPARQFAGQATDAAASLGVVQ